MPYIGKSPLHGNYQKLDDFSGDFDGSDATHALATNSIALTPVTEAAVIISINGVIQEPVTDYTVSGTNITFTTAPASGANFFGVVLGEQLAIGTPSDSTITAAKLASTFLTGATDIGAAIVDADLLLVDDGAGGTLRKTAASRLKTYIGGNDPSSADGQALGSTSLEWSDLYLADGGVIYFGADQDVTVTHVHNDGLIVKSIPTADNNPLVLTLQTGETTMVADEPIAQIHFQAPDEASGTDSILIAATIQATAETDFSASVNATSLDFLTGNSAAAGSDGGSLILGSTGNLTLKDLRTADGSSPTLTLQSGDTDMAADDILGKISFQAPDEGTGTDAIVVSAAIQARSEGDFAADANATSIDFMVGASGAAATKMTLNSTGNLLIGDGTVSLPSLTNTGDLNTGIYFPAADQVGVVVGGTEKVRFGSNPFTGQNLLINGSMTIAQRGTITDQGGTDAVYTACDRWVNQANGSPQGRYTSTQDTTSTGEFGYQLKIDCTTAEAAVAAGESICVVQSIEAQSLQHLRYGNAAAKTLMLTFTMTSPKSGTHCVALVGRDGSRSYVREFTVASADTAETLSVTFPGDASGTINNDAGVGLDLVFPLVSGSNFQVAADGWASGIDFATSNQQNLLDNTSNNFLITGVQLEVGEVATAFQHQNITEELTKCLRYFRRYQAATDDNITNGRVNSTTHAYGAMPIVPVMRAAPTLTVSGATDFVVGAVGASVATTAIAIEQSTFVAGMGGQVVGLHMTVASGLTAGHAVNMRFDGGGTRTFDLDSEL